MSNLVEHAERELKAAELDKPDSDYEGMLAKAVLELIQVFARQGHSGASASMVISLFTLLAKYQPLGALTGADEEWVEVGTNIFQNNRCSHVFKENNIAYDIQGRIFEEPDGCRFTNHESRVQIVFPYTPSSEIIKIQKQKRE